MNAVEIIAQKSAYLVLQLPLSRCSREDTFINTSVPEDRICLIKNPKQLKELSEDSTDVETKGILDKYATRPNILEDWCLADFVPKITVKKKLIN